MMEGFPSMISGMFMLTSLILEGNMKRCERAVGSMVAS